MSQCFFFLKTPSHCKFIGSQIAKMKTTTVLLAAFLTMFTTNALDKCEICKSLAFTLRFAPKMKTSPEEVSGYLF